MIRNTLLLGALLTILGTGTFALVGFDAARVTALLPAVFGGLLLLLGLAARKKRAWRKRLFYVAVGLALLAFLGTVAGLVETLALLLGREVARPVAAVEQGITAVLSAGFVIRSVQAFRAARRSRLGEEA